MSVDLLNLHGCIVKDEKGRVMATLLEGSDGIYRVVRKPACDMSMYFSILMYLQDLGVEAK